MRLLVDSDIFCKLGVTGLLEDGVRLLGAGIEECGRLPALPHMLRRGALPKLYGAEACEKLLPVAQRMRSAPTPSAKWLDLVALEPDIDPGEAQLFALAADASLPVITGDQRALRALKNVRELPIALAGLIVASDAILLALCDHLGCEAVRQHLALLLGIDKMIRVCFSPENSDPREALISYFRSLSSDLNPLVLWKPPGGDV